MHFTDNINRRAYFKKNVALNYTLENKLQKPEEVILKNIRENILGKPILDIGVGGGRTTQYLREVSDNYIGIDYSPAMVEVCRRSFPNVKFLCHDARQLSVFRDEQFALVLFSFNGIDCVSHVDRLIILKEIFRVLRNEGYFVFSSHNRNCASFNRFQFPKFRFGIVKIIKDSVRTLQHICNHIRYRRYEVHTAKYSIINDSELHYSVLTYYIGMEEQIEQLVDVGFQGGVTAYDLSGEKISRDHADTSSTWLYYCVQKQ
jgi:ubiquinone/menaquinone biosynthesis C-methylase UbiE